MAKSICVVSCLIFWFSWFKFTSIECASNETDLLALLSFKAAINADPLGALNSWNETSDFCTWKGVSCGGARHRSRVVAIGLVSKGLVGSLSPHIGNLSFLRAIALRNNSFYGQIPTEIGFLRRLEFVEFSNNSFVGPIPRNLSQCPNLVYLNLIDNSLSGRIPFELGYLYRLRDLGLGKNNLSGSIPSVIGNLTSLRQISLGSCDFGGEIPESFSQLRNLQYFFANVNRLTGTIPSGLFNLSGLSSFEVALNQLEGALPASIGLTLPNLERLYLAGNMFSGKIPISLANATLLEDIDFTANSFHGPIPKELGSLSSLITFHMEYNQIQDDINIISSFTNCTNLSHFVVSNNFLGGSLPYSIANLSTKIIWLSISENQIHGKVHSGIRSLLGLTRLSLGNNYLSGPIPFSVGQLSNLHELYLGDNRLTGKIPYTLENLTLLNHLELQDNYLSGNIPRNLSRCTNLLSLDLANNNLNGSIPEEIMSLSSISVLLDLSNNAFTGSIPDDVGSLTNLAILNLSNNRLSGQIPKSLRSCNILQGLYLEGNLLQGEIPPDLSALRGLQELDLSRNNLSSKIPVFLGNLKLENLNLSFNILQGEVPREGVFRNRTAVSLDGNKGLCGGVPELKLTPCSSQNPSIKNRSTLKKILIPVAGGICFTFALCFLIYVYRHKMTIKNPSSLVASFIGTQFMRLSYTDLLKATGGFSEENLLGAGRFGSVYKGILVDGQTPVAVKVLNLFVKGASKSFVAECNALKGLKHRNLLKILSVCDSVDYQQNEFKALVYEFQANGSLEKWLHRNTEQEEHDTESRSLNMLERLKIAIDVAHALEYLHVGSNSTIVHGDLKPSNILLDQDMNAHVGDFGLAEIVISSIVPSHQNSSSTAVKGTVGYVPPEYGTSGSFSTKGDVYSYGILLLEMFTNKKPTDDEFGDGVNLHNFVSNALPDRAMEIVDPLMILMENEITNKKKDCVVSILHVGVGCSREAPRDRLLMTNVVGELCKIRDVLVI